MNNTEKLTDLKEMRKKSLRIVSLAEISLRYKVKVDVNTCPQVTSPNEAVEVLREIWDEDTIQLREEFVILLLNPSKKCLGWSKISSGGARATIVDPSAIFRVALNANADSIILAHNYPSGNLQPSTADIQLSKRIDEIGRLHGITVADHIILTATNFASLKTQMLF